MKKFLSLILTLVLVLNIFAGTGIFAIATEGGEECTHTDGGDDYNNVCDYCNEYIGTGELALGENTVMMTDYNKYKRDLIRFVPTESGYYYFYSTMSENDPRALLFDSDLQQLVYDDDGNGYPNFGFVYELEAGETYYLSVVTYSDLAECSVTVEKHEHSGGFETCKGLLCDCGRYYGVTTYEHRLDATQTCIGYQCYDCGEYFGEGNGIHQDTNDYLINICYYCGEYIGQKNAFVGENTVFVVYASKVYVSFTPSENGIYIIRSQSEYNPNIYVCDSAFNELAYDNDSGEGDNFTLAIELEAGKNYYLLFEEYSEDNLLTYFIEKHEHSGGVQTCNGYLCECGLYYGQAGLIPHSDGNDDYTNICDDCLSFLGEDLVLGSSEVKCDFSDYITWQIYRFVPSESGKYTILSVNGEDPYARFFQSINGDIEYMDDADDNSILGKYDFSLNVELEEGEEYYFGFYSYDNEDSFEILFARHDECVDMLTTCNGTYCSFCSEHINDTADENVHLWIFGECLLCETAIPDDYAHEHEWFYGNCKICNDLIPDDYAHEHNWNDGDCIICDGTHDCQGDEWDEYGYCSVCDDDAGFKIIRDGKVTYYKGLTATVEAMQDGDFIVMLENRSIEDDYDIYADVTVDLNGHKLYDGAIYIYGDVTFMDSTDDSGYCSSDIYVYGDATFVSGQYDYIGLLNGKSFADEIPECSDFYIEDSNGDDVLVDVSEYTYIYAWYITIVPNGDRHVASDYRITEGTICESSAVETAWCIYCDTVVDEREIEGNSGHLWSGNYGEGTKNCDICHETVEDAVYSDELVRDFVREVYEWLKGLLGNELMAQYQALLDMLN
ncbi:MAG: hypothetical protein J6S23_00665 [Clostridia bacterium]|nr:hypothetical protein [Clostridia bacterium]